MELKLLFTSQFLAVSDVLLSEKGICPRSHMENSAYHNYFCAKLSGSTLANEYFFTFGVNFEALN